MPSRLEIITFDDAPAPPGESPWVPGAGPAIGVEVVDADPAWPELYDDLAARIRTALGWRVLNLEHIGSTAVPGLPAKPIIDLTVADPDDERELYAEAKHEAAAEANASGEHAMQYNARKARVVREIYHRAFVAAGLLEE